MKTLLIMAVPKRVIAYSGPESYEALDALSKFGKPKGTRTKKLPKQFRQPTKVAQEVASIYADEPKEPAPKKPKVSVDGGKIVSDSSKAKAIKEVKALAGAVSTTPASTTMAPPIPEDKLPTNFNALIRPFFEEFWKLEFENTEVTWAFFAKISATNCAEYKLTSFAETSSSLAVIKVSSLYTLSLPFIISYLY
jgi:hypothetical protein